MDHANQRMRRAAAARILIALAEDGNLAEPERWDWETLDDLPIWCLLDEARRRHLQLIAGGLLLAPELRLWIDRRRISHLREVLGPVCVERLLTRADAFAGTGSPVTGTGALPFDADRNAVERYLATAGASVLRATLHPSLPLQALDAALGDAAGELPEAVGTLLLTQAESLLDDVDSKQAAA